MLFKDNNKILEWVEALRFSDKSIIVEGRKDKIALESLGVRNVLELGGRPIFQVVEEMAELGNECIILTDLDKEGRKISSGLSRQLQKMGIKVDNRFREFLFRETKLRQIEGLAKYLERVIIKETNIYVICCVL